MLGVDVHWSDAASTPEAFVGRDISRRRDRAERITLIDRILRPAGIRARDWQGTSYVLSTLTGKTAVVDHLGRLWAEAERLAGRPLDPLAPDLIVALERAGEPEAADAGI